MPPMPQPQTPWSLLFTPLPVLCPLTMSLMIQMSSNPGVLLFPQNVDAPVDPKLCPLGDFSFLSLSKGQPERGWRGDAMRLWRPHR